ncbi:hypothetical protein KY320_00475, partial [Candidatus Woesearchaeota archaeon]|nr:hypothetical protein [Candidatus Woesearchaeota archaeon]
MALHKKGRSRSKQILLAVISLSVVLLVSGLMGFADEYSQSVVSNISLNKWEYFVGESVIIKLVPPFEARSLIIVYNDSAYEYAGTLEENIEYLPKWVGEYSLRLADIYTSSFEEVSFQVLAPDTNSSEEYFGSFSSSDIDNNSPGLFGLPEQNSDGCDDISIFREQAEGLKQGGISTVRLYLISHESTCNNVGVVEIIPDGWSMVEYPEDIGNYTEGILNMHIPYLNQGSVRSLEYKVQAPSDETQYHFETILIYGNSTHDITKRSSAWIEVNSSRAWFETGLDLYGDDTILTRGISTGYGYRAIGSVTNIGIAVKNYTTYYRLFFDPAVFRVYAGNGCNVVESSPKDYLECQFEDFEENKTYSFEFEIEALEEQTGYLDVKVTYDPPMKEPGWLTKVFNKLKICLGKIYEFFRAGITGFVTVESAPIASPAEVKSTNTVPIASLKSIDRFVTGNVKLDCSESYDPDGDNLNYAFAISDDRSFNTKRTLCLGEESVCDWDTSETEDICKKDCYIKAVVYDDILTSESKIIITSVDNTPPQITKIVPASGESLKTASGSARCVAEDQYELDYSIEVFYQGGWHSLCERSECSYDLSDVEDSEIRIRCTVKDRFFEVSETSRRIRLDIEDKLSVPNSITSGSGTSTTGFSGSSVGGGTASGSMGKEESQNDEGFVKVWITTELGLFVSSSQDTSNIEIEISDSSEVKRNHTVKILTDKGNGLKDALVEFDAGPINSLKLHNTNTKKELKIRIEELTELEDISIRGRSVKRVYAIDPSGTDFTDGLVSVTAQGSELWKCANWDFAGQRCLGYWKRIMGIVPDTEYSFVLTPDDPGYAETGVASVNTIKSIYHPGEIAEILIVVLDTSGYLVSGADVELTVTAPDNNSTFYSTRIGDIMETSKGVYVVNYSDTSIEGNYTIFVEAISSGVNTTMISHFAVYESYEFDILRELPVTTDPWQGAFDSVVRILSNEYTGMFSYTEVVPADFEVSEYGNAEKSGYVDRIHLTWHNLTNDSIVSYKAQPPLVAPNLYSIGPSRVVYGVYTFDEARPWFLAIDPSPESLLSTSGQWYPLAGPAIDSTDLDDLNSAGGLGLLLDANDNDDDFTVVINDTTPEGVIGEISQVHIVVEWNNFGGVDDGELIIEGRSNGYDGTLFCTGSNVGSGTVTVDCDAQWSFTESQLNSLVVNVINDGTGNEDCRITYLHVDVVYTEVNPPPEVVLLTPTNNDWLTYRNVNFTYNVTSDDGISNCSLWTDEGGWSLKESNATGIINSSINWINDSFSSDGDFKWNIECYDGSGSGGFADENWTVRIDTTPPTVSLEEPEPNYFNDFSDPVDVTFNCSITDNADSANISLYITDHTNQSFGFSDSCSISGVNSSCVWIKSLQNGNYTWNCLGYDINGWYDWGENQTILINSSISAPRIHEIQCEESVGVWGSCYDVAFTDNLLAIRVNCSDNDGSIVNATFNLTNIPDQNTYFSGNATSNQGDWWYFNNTDLLINDSGDFKLEVTCWDNTALSTTNQTEWFLPWGTLTASLVSPVSDTSVYQNETFTFTAEIECNGGECGDVNAT